nr:hypothetical protein CFP56_08056 [Quercus suber]
MKRCSGTGIRLPPASPLHPADQRRHGLENPRFWRSRCAFDDRDAIPPEQSAHRNGAPASGECGNGGYGDLVDLFERGSLAGRRRAQQSTPLQTYAHACLCRSETKLKRPHCTVLSSVDFCGLDWTTSSRLRVLSCLVVARCPDGIGLAYFLARPKPRLSSMRSA